MNRYAIGALMMMGLVAACAEYRRPPRPQAQIGVDAGADGGAGGSGGPCGLATESDAPVEPALAPPPITGGHLAAVGDGTWVAGDPDRGLLWHLDGTGVLAQIPFSREDWIGRVAVSGRKAWVVLRRAGVLAEVDLDTRIVTRRETCVEPRALLIRGGDAPLVGCADGTIESFDAAGVPTVFLQSPLLDDLRDLEFDGSRLLASTFRTAQVFEVTTAGVFPLLTVRGDASSVPRVGWRLRQGVLTAQDQTTTVVPIAQCSAYGGVDAPSVVTSALYSVDGARLTRLETLSDAVLPVDVVRTPSAFFVASAGSQSVVRVVPDGGTSTIALPGMPTSVAADDGTVAVFVREPAQLILLGEDGALRSAQLLGASSVASTGHHLFHRSTTARIACASCHPEAGEDGHVWSLAAHPRRTPTLRGGFSSTAPFHWGGEERDMSVLMANVLTGRMAGPLQSAARTASLVSWLDAQPALRTPRVDLSAAERGRALFESEAVGCASCHAGAQGTNNETVDVGTGGAFQVPRLVELSWRTHLLHDGSLLRLEDRLREQRDSHGRLSALSEAERGDLLAYLRSR